MKKKIICVLAIVFLFILAAIFVIYKREVKNSIAKVCFKENCFNVELATNFSQQSRGLMFRESLEQDKGMLFIFKQEGEHAFWMKNTLIPLDIIWINQNQEVVFIKKDFQPCAEDNCEAVKPDKKAKYVLEVISGTIDRIGLKTGDKLEINIE